MNGTSREEAHLLTECTPSYIFRKQYHIKAPLSTRFAAVHNHTTRLIQYVNL